MRFKVKVDGGRAARRVLRQRLFDAERIVARGVSQEVAAHVRQKIPSGGWYNIYRNAITYFSVDDGRLWAVSGLWPTEFSTFPAETTLVIFEVEEGLPDDSPIRKIGNVMKGREPWPIDQIPAISGGYRLTATGRPASEKDVETRREALLKERAQIIDDLVEAGAQVLPNMFPVISGTVYADVAYMAQALEHGLAGLKRVPHWASAFLAAKNKMGAWIAGKSGQIQAALDGQLAFTDEEDRMPPGLEEAIRKPR